VPEGAPYERLVVIDGSRTPAARTHPRPVRRVVFFQNSDSPPAKIYFRHSHSDFPAGKGCARLARGDAERIRPGGGPGPAAGWEWGADWYCAGGMPAVGRLLARGVSAEGMPAEGMLAKVILTGDRPGAPGGQAAAVTLAVMRLVLVRGQRTVAQSIVAESRQRDSRGNGRRRAATSME
jgi:hypothetical protein